MHRAFFMWLGIERMLPEPKLMGELKKIKNNKPEMRVFCPDWRAVLRDELYISDISHISFREYLQQVTGSRFQLVAKLYA